MMIWLFLPSFFQDWFKNPTSSTNLWREWRKNRCEWQHVNIHVESPSNSNRKIQSCNSRGLKLSTSRHEKIKMETRILRKMIKTETSILMGEVGEDPQLMTNEYNKMIQNTKRGYSDKVNHFTNYFIRTSGPHWMIMETPSESISLSKSGASEDAHAATKYL